MAFRRRFRRGFRRRGTPWETTTVVQCFGNSLPITAPTCTLPTIDVIPLLTMTIPFQAAPERYPATVGAKALIFGGIKFQSEHVVDPSSDTIAGGDPSILHDVAALIHIWEAIVLLPLAQGSTFAPSYLPVLSSPASQSVDFADRVLWKRISHLPFWGLAVSNNFPQLESTIRDTAHGQEVVKTKCRVDDRHGLYYVRNAFWDVVLPAGDIVAPKWDFYAKMFWKQSRV